MDPSTILVNDFRKDQFDLATYSNYSQVELQYCIHKRKGDRTHAKESRKKLACRCKTTKVACMVKHELREKL